MLLERPHDTHKTRGVNRFIIFGVLQNLLQISFLINKNIVTYFWQVVSCQAARLIFKSPLISDYTGFANNEESLLARDHNISPPCVPIVVEFYVVCLLADIRYPFRLDSTLLLLIFILLHLAVVDIRV